MNLTNLSVYDDPFPILVFDDIFPKSLVLAAANSFPGFEWDNWHKYNDDYSIKYGTKDGRNVPPACLNLLDKMSEFPLEDFYGPLKLTTTEFFPDMAYHAGGLHCIEKGGKLDCHIDALHHPLKKWDRLVNLVLYVTPNWKDACGGEFNAYEVLDGIKHIKRSFLPKFNRLLVFPSTNISWHSVSPVVEGCQHRKSLASYFWTHSDNKLNTSAKFE